VVILPSAVQSDCDPEDRGTTIGQQLTQRRSVTLRQPTNMLEAIVDVIRIAGVQAVQAQVVRGVLHQYGLTVSVRCQVFGGSDVQAAFCFLTKVRCVTSVRYIRRASSDANMTARLLGHGEFVRAVVRSVGAAHRTC